MRDEIRASLARYLPGYEVRSVARLGEGLDNTAYEVNDGLIVRASKEADPERRSESIRREANLLAVVCGLSPLPVPEPLFADPGAGLIAYSKLPGVSLFDHPVADPARLAAPLGEFLTRLHRAPVQRMGKLVGRDADPPTMWRQWADLDYREISDSLPAAACRRVEDFLGRPPPAEKGAPVFCHNDLGAEHLLVDVRANTITGVIDWTDAAIADPARDLALVYRDLGPEIFDLTLAHYASPFDAADRGRAIFYARCKLIGDLAYGLGTPGARRYAQAGLMRLARTFS